MIETPAIELVNGAEVPVILEIIPSDFIAEGAFGSVFKASIKLKSDCTEKLQLCALKQFKSTLHAKNRELEILRHSTHPNVVSLKYHFESLKDGEAYTNLIFEYLPTNLSTLNSRYVSKGESFPIDLIKILLFQLLRGLSFLHRNSVCHRDIKPDNLIVDDSNYTLKIGDFGSAVKFTLGQKYSSYICSRYYRAPELILGSRTYSYAIDIWSVGCVLGELMSGKPLFVAGTAIDLFCEICKLLGTPDHDDLNEMNSNLCNFTFPRIDKVDIFSVFSKDDHRDLVELLILFLVYKPSQRIEAKTALCHRVFKEFIKTCSLTKHEKNFPQLVNFTDDELRFCPDFKILQDIFENFPQNSAQ
ncbi:Protein kinase gsk3 [Thelohanellus kitauei]|uniref:Protein kinase gsk3 n=1 Tax=Thelohanellus kitauei TaxID=669202 RepID=A0A0C2MTY0_THEKT|nr:Protein kinase gsk3 [Thelohanellus kitauei]